MAKSKKKPRRSSNSRKMAYVIKGIETSIRISHGMLRDAEISLIKLHTLVSAGIRNSRAENEILRDTYGTANTVEKRLTGLKTEIENILNYKPR